MYWKGLQYLLLLIIVSSACQQPTQNTSQPNAPKALYQHTRMDVQNEKHRSVVNIPVDISMADVAKQINLQVQGLIYEDNSFEDDNRDNFKTKVWKRAPIIVEARDSLIYYTVPLKIWAEKAYTVMGISGSQSTEFQINLKFLTRFEIKPNWEVTTQTASAGFDWITKPNIRVAGMEIPITGLVSSKITENLGSISKAIDDNVSKNFIIKPYVIEAWNLIREPRMLSEEYRTWLVVTPTDIIMTPLDIQNGHIKANIGIKGFTQTIMGDKPIIKPIIDIPPLSLSNQVPQGFQIGIIGTLPYDEAAKWANQQFNGKKYEFRDGKYQIEVLGIDIYGHNESLVIKADLKGDINGTIYMKGIPYYDANQKTVSLKNLEYDLSTQNFLIKTANWLLQGTFAKQLEKQFVFPIAPQIEEAQNSIKQQLNYRKVAKGIEFRGQLDALEPDQIYLTQSAIIALIVAKGKINVRIEGLL